MSETASQRPHSVHITASSAVSNEARAALRHALMRQVWDSMECRSALDTLAVANGILRNTGLLDAIVAYRQEQDRRFTARQIQDAVMAVLDTRQVSLWLEHPQDTTTPYGPLHPEDAGHIARWVAETLTDITEEPTDG